MPRTILQRGIKCFILSLICLFVIAPVEAQQTGGEASNVISAKADAAYSQGNYKDAYELYRSLLIDGAGARNEHLTNSLTRVGTCLQQLGRTDELDDLLEQAARIHTANWRVVAQIATQYLSAEHAGYMVAGKYSRGYHRGGGRYVSSFDRDRVRALQLYRTALAGVRPADSQYEVADLYYRVAQALNSSEHGYANWKLQHLTVLDTLPDYEEYSYSYGEQLGTPVGVDGTPIYYSVPASFEAAKSDGERWRWALAKVVEYNSARGDEIQFLLANFFHDQYSERTMQQAVWAGREESEDSGEKNESGTFALHTLGETETIAKLASGIKRFTLPDEFNFIRIYKALTEKQNSAYREQAFGKLAEVFEDRRQYEKAADYLKRAIELFGPGYRNERQKRLDQIVGAWGRFEPVMTQPAGESGATVDFLFRNAKSATFEAFEIDVEKLLGDVKQYLKSNPKELEWEKLELNDIGSRLVARNQSQYLGKRAAQWTLELEPRANHFDRRVTIKTPLRKAGAYLLSARVAGGNESRIVVWVSDTVILRKPLGAESLYYVADAVTGKPIANAKVALFGYQQERIENPGVLGKISGRWYNIVTRESSLSTDQGGQITVKSDELRDRYNWLVTATTSDGRLAYLGFANVWYMQRGEAPYDQVKVFAITDRPVYRPGQEVKFKVWVGKAKYDLGDETPYANKKFELLIRDPRGEDFRRDSYTADTFGGFEGKITLPKDAGLGAYSLSLPNYGGGLSFRVEEYKKPEFEVLIEAPSEPVQLGETIAAKVKAKYYFGSPVTNAKVKYKVLRSARDSRWFPIGVWDWFFGGGYWWFSYDYDWFPGWNLWGCLRPSPWWWTQRQDPPEIVQENEVQIGADGVVEIKIDTLPAKELHGNTDHKYEITAEVVDQSRRTITGTGEVLVARAPFKVFAWVDRGHYRAGDTVQAEFQARRVDGKPVTGKGTLKLLSLKYDAANKPLESVVEEWAVDTDVEGHARKQIKAARPGQYRLSYTVTDTAQHAIEGGYIFTVGGEGFSGESYRYNDIEIVPDKREYAAGEKVRLMINTNRADSSVLLFLRPNNGVYAAPELLSLKGKSTIVEVPVSNADMPNFFVEAVTVSNGRVHSEVREIVVPPEERILNVAVTPIKQEFKPAEKASIKVRLTDLAGKPFVGSTVISVYDRALEYISGGSNVPDIKEYFWKWRRTHTPLDQNSLQRGSRNLLKDGELTLTPVGTFGASLADEDSGIATSRIEGFAKELRYPMSRSFARKDNNGGEMLAEASMDMVGGAAPAPQKLAGAMREEGAVSGSASGGAAATTPMIRKEFADLAFWAGALTTDAKGEAEVEFTMPENLTDWKIKSWAFGRGTRVGQGEAAVVTKKNLLLRMQTPRFFVEKDEVVLSANVHNYLSSAKAVTVRIELDGELLSLDGSNREQAITIPNNGEQRVDWRIKVLREGEATVRMFALTDEESDAMELKIPVQVHGMLKTESFSGMLRPNESKGGFKFSIPKERRPEQTRLEIRYSPTLAGALVDALPYLVSYPYGCTEQTLSRFLPTVITQRILQGMKLDLKAIQEKRTNLNAQEIGDDKERAKQWKRYDTNPVFDQDEVATMAKAGLDRLVAMQLSDGGWGWFSGWGEHAYAHTTAYVVHGLQIAVANGLSVDSGVIERGLDWLKNYQAAELQKIKNAKTKTEPWKDAADNLDAFVFMVLVDAKRDNAEMLELLYRDRNELAVYGKAMFALGLHRLNEAEKLGMVRKNIEQYLVQDNENQTAYLKLPESNSWWNWYGSEYEAQSYYLKLLAAIDAKGAVAPRLVKYLLNNRKNSTYWNSTRDTAIAIEALADYLRASGEDSPELKIEIFIDGKKEKEVQVSRENLFTFDNKLVLEGSALTDGGHNVELRKSGTGPLYFNGYASNFTLEDFITRAGLEVKVNRKYYKLARSEKKDLVQGSRGQAIEQQVEKYERTPLENLSLVKSGDLVEIELEIESKNDYEYLVFEDMKPAGFEPLDVRSGYNGNDMGAYVEFRDNRVAFFVRTLARGKHSVSYRMRSEIPGRFSALPTHGYAMYAPELRGNSDEIKLLVED